jgi:hypothetical protein
MLVYLSERRKERDEALQSGEDGFLGGEEIEKLEMPRAGVRKTKK